MTNQIDYQLEKNSSRIVAHIQSEHKRWLKRIQNHDPYLSRTTVGLQEVLRAHFLLAEYFALHGEGLGGIGPKSIDLLHSALYRQNTEFAGRVRWKDPIENCASLMFGLIQNHPFHDANKRTAFLTTLLHLQKIGRTPTVDGQEFEDFTVAVANHELHNHRYYDRFPDIATDRDIATISYFLRRNSREIDVRHKNITYKKLQTILASRGLVLQSPQHNRIDLMRIKDASGRFLAKPVRLTKVGFRSWTTEVSAKDMHIIRAASELDAAHGYDSQSFFNGVQTPLDLIKKYREPLERLAYR